MQASPMEASPTAGSEAMPQEIFELELPEGPARRLHEKTLGRIETDYPWDSLDPSLTPLQRANELIVRICCVGEAISLPLLSGCMKAARHPLTRAVLQKIVQDEALHGQLGWMYLDWIGHELDATERERLGRVAAETLRTYAPIWERLRSRAADGVTTEGYELEHIHELGWMEAQAYRALAFESVEAAVRQPLARYGIAVPSL